MNSARTVVVTDVSAPSRFVRCLRQVVASVPRDVEVVAVSSRRPALPPAVARRVRTVAVHGGEKISTAVTAEATRPRLVVVVRSDCRVEGDWLDRLSDAALGLGAAAGVVGGDDAHLIVFPAGVLSAGAPRVALPDVPGVTLGSREPAGQAGASTRSSVSASLIVKDEEAVIGRCVAAVLPFVDEVVVYDTGSTDSTPALAEAAGARVVRGYWDESFGAARNRALDLCRGDWVLQVDADEVVMGDPATFRAFLDNEPADVVQASLVNTTWDGGTDGQAFLLARVFRRERCRWQGVLHEMLVERHDGTKLQLARSAAPLKIVHSGYAASTVELRDKVSRNLSLARAAIESGDTSCAAWCNYGRTLLQAGQKAEALAALRNVPERPGPDTIHVLAGRAALECVTDDVDEAEFWFDVLRSHGESAGALTLRRAQLSIALGDLPRAEELLEEVTFDTDPWGLPVDRVELEFARASLLRAQGRMTESWQTVLTLATEAPDRVPLRSLLVCALGAGHSYHDVVAVVPPAVIDRSLRECLYLDPRDADRWLDAVWAASSSPGSALAAGLIGPHLAFERVLEWELRAFQVGLDADSTPLAVLVSHDDVPVVERALAAAVRWEVLLRSEAEEEFRGLVGSLCEDDVPAALGLLDEYAPRAAALARELVPAVPAAAASGP